jgi:molybdopterin-synthase adenylyltransferase
VTLGDAQLDRYARHIVLREIGGEGQRRLLAAHIVLVGAGGIG